MGDGAGGGHFLKKAGHVGDVVLRSNRFQRPVFVAVGSEKGFLEGQSHGGFGQEAIADMGVGVDQAGKDAIGGRRGGVGGSVLDFGDPPVPPAKAFARGRFKGIAGPDQTFCLYFAGGFKGVKWDFHTILKEYTLGSTKNALF